MRGKRLFSRKRDNHLDIKPILDEWDKQEGQVTARIFTDRYGQYQLQMRINCGLIQMYMDGRPDGEAIGGCQSFLEYMEQQVIRDGCVEEYEIREETDVWEELEREMNQFYYRRIALLAVGRDAQCDGDMELAKMCFAKAIRDADYTLNAIEFIKEYCDDEDYVEIHQRTKSFVIWHRTIARAQLSILAGNADEAIELIKEGREQIEMIYIERGLNKWLKYEPAIKELKAFERHIRQKYNIPMTLKEQLEQAIMQEDYERAAEIRNLLDRRL